MDIDFLSSTFVTLLKAVPTTLGLFAASVSCGIVLAFGLVWMRVAGGPLLSRVAGAYIFLFRGTPLLIQMFLVFYGLAQFPVIRQGPLWPFLRDPFICAVLSLALCTAAYSAEIFRAALRAVPPREIEAARAVGMSGFLLTRLILVPVALRHALPAYSTELTMMVKSTALASLVTVWEVTGVAQKLISETYRTMEVFLCAAVIYIAINVVILQAIAVLEHRLSPHRRPAPAVPVPAAKP